jgi:hypothetical protein
MYELHNTHGFTFNVSEIAGGSHSSLSRHYAGVAFDINQLNGQAISAGHPKLSQLLQAGTNMGAQEVLKPGDAGHSTHVHFAWPRPQFLHALVAMQQQSSPQAMVGDTLQSNGN